MMTKLVDRDRPARRVQQRERNAGNRQHPGHLAEARDDGGQPEPDHRPDQGGQGTVGKLVESDETHKNLNDALVAVKEGVAGLDKALGQVRRTHSTSDAAEYLFAGRPIRRASARRRAPGRDTSPSTSSRRTRRASTGSSSRRSRTAAGWTSRHIDHDHVSRRPHARSHRRPHGVQGRARDLGAVRLRAGRLDAARRADRVARRRRHRLRDARRTACASPPTSGTSTGRTTSPRTRRSRRGTTSPLGVPDRRLGRFPEPEPEGRLDLHRRRHAVDRRRHQVPAGLGADPPVTNLETMKARVSTVFACQSCGAVSPKWLGRCPECGEWNTYVEEVRGAAPAPARAESLAVRDRRARPRSGAERISTTLPGLDRVLGGGLVPGSVVLLGGEPGIGKSTLLLQAGRGVAGAGEVLYATGEESAAPGAAARRAARDLARSACSSSPRRTSSRIVAARGEAAAGAARRGLDPGGPRRGALLGRRDGVAGARVARCCCSASRRRAACRSS